MPKVERENYESFEAQWLSGGCSASDFFDVIETDQVFAEWYRERAEARRGGYATAGVAQTTPRP